MASAESSSRFEKIRSDDAGEVFDRAARALVAAGEIHRLFDLRLMQRQHELGLPAGRRMAFDDVDESLREPLEAVYLEACREAGTLLAEAGRLREAWVYLRPTGDKSALRDKLARTNPDDGDPDELIELALFEGVDPERGFAWLVGRSGTCNAITTLDGLQPQLSPAAMRACAAVLVRHVYAELRGNLRGHLNRLTGEPPPDLTVRELVEQYPQLTAAGDYHLDPSHLASTVRNARVLTERALVEKALEMAEYGARLPADMQYPGEPPFEQLYEAHRLLLSATLGREVDAAREFFWKQARDATPAQAGLVPLETLLVLLVRTGDPAAALAAYTELAPRDAMLSAYAPTPLELAIASGQWDQYEALCRDHDDMVGFASGVVARQKK